MLRENPPDATKAMAVILRHKSEHCDEFLTYLKRYLDENFWADLDPTVGITLTQLASMKIIQALTIFGKDVGNIFRMIEKVNLFVQRCSKEFNETGSIKLDETEQFFYSSFLAVRLKNEFSEFMRYLYPPEESQMKVGVFLVVTFEEVIVPKLLDNLDVFLRFAKRHQDRMSYTLRYLDRITSYYSKNRKNHTKDEMFVDWNFFTREVCMDSSKMAEGLKLANYLNSLKNLVRSNELWIKAIADNKIIVKVDDDLETNLEFFQYVFERNGASTQSR